MNQLEVRILDWIHTHLTCGFLDTVMPWITKLGDAGIFWILLTLLFLILRKTRPLGIAMGIALIADLICCNVLLKPIFNRTRPFVTKEMLDGISVELLVKRPKDASFPSGHTAASFACAFAMIFKGQNKWWIPSTVLACMIAFSRVYLYVHYPTDILGGVVVGLLAGFLGVFFGKMVEKYLRNKYPKLLSLSSN